MVVGVVTVGDTGEEGDPNVIGEESVGMVPFAIGVPVGAGMNVKTGAGVAGVAAEAG